MIASLAFNTMLRVIKEYPGDWYFVSTETGQLGYVAKIYVKTNLNRSGFRRGLLA